MNIKKTISDFCCFLIIEYSVLIFTPIPWTAFISLLNLIPVLIVIYICYRLCTKWKNWSIRRLIIYFSWLIITFISVIWLTLAVAGASMAVVDGGASVSPLDIIHAWHFILITVVYAHCAIIPWVFLSTSIIKKSYSHIFS